MSEMKMTKYVYQEMTDQVMTRLASMLPERYRGEYKDLEIISDKYIQYKIELYRQSSESIGEGNFNWNLKEDIQMFKNFRYFLKDSNNI